MSLQLRAEVSRLLTVMYSVSSSSGIALSERNAPARLPRPPKPPERALLSPPIKALSRSEEKPDVEPPPIREEKGEVLPPTAA